MKKIMMKTMKTSISEVIETMFFLPVEFAQELTLTESGIDKTNNLACRLAFTGDFSGNVILIAPENLVLEMAENFMGEPQKNLTDEHLFDTLAEMLNMICGNALSKTTSNLPFEIGIPEVIDKSDISEKDLFTMIETTESKMAISLKLD